MAVQASLVWPKIDEILEFADFLDRFFSYHPVVPWNGQEPLPAIQGTLTQHSGPLLNIFWVAAGSIRTYGKAKFCDFHTVLTPFLPLLPFSGL